MRVLPYAQFMEIWLVNEQEQREYLGDDAVDCIIERTHCTLYGFTDVKNLEDREYVIYFYEMPIDFYFLHELTHVIETLRGEGPDEDRTIQRHMSFFYSGDYTEWLKENY